MSIHPFSGTGVAIVTPFLDNGDIDITALGKLIEHLINGKVDYLVALGTTGETATLSFEEKATVLSLVNTFNNGRVRLVAGIGGNDTRAVVQGLTSFDLTGYSAIHQHPNNTPHSKRMQEHHCYKRSFRKYGADYANHKGKTSWLRGYQWR